MNRVVSVDKSLIAGGTVQWYVVMADGSRVQVDESAAERFKQVLQAEASQSGPQVLTETIPLS